MYPTTTPSVRSLSTMMRSISSPSGILGGERERGEGQMVLFTMCITNSDITEHIKPCDNHVTVAGPNSQFSDNDEVPSTLKGFMERQNVGRFSCHLEQGFHLSPYLWFLPGTQSHVLCCQYCASLFVNTLMNNAKPTSEEGGGEGREGEGRGKGGGGGGGGGGRGSKKGGSGERDREEEGGREWRGEKGRESH